MWGHPPCSPGVRVMSVPMSIDTAVVINFIILTIPIIDENPIEALELKMQNAKWNLQRNWEYEDICKLFGQNTPRSVSNNGRSD
jgi:hypothetical protein